MKPIQAVHINYFKFFADNEPIKIDSKHLLLYGENGSGKSSIYWALYTLLEAVGKDTSKLDRYFAKGDSSCLLNLNTPDAKDSFVKVTLQNNTEYKIALGDYTVKTQPNAQATFLGSDFINYRFMFKISDFKHRDEMDLFNLFEKELFPYLKVIKSIRLIHQAKESFDCKEIWEDLKKGERKIPTNAQMMFNPLHLEEEYVTNLRRFVEELSGIITRINIEGNTLLHDKLGYNSLRFELQCEQEFKKFGGGGELGGRESDNPVGLPKIHLKIPDYEGHTIARPQSFLNEAKWAAIGIAIRFAIVDIKKDYVDNTDFQLLVLDDLLVSLDMSNRRKVLDMLLDKYADDYQIFMFTHDRGFFEFAKHQIKSSITKDDWLNLEMYAGVKDSVSLPTLIVNESNLSKAKKCFDLNEYEMAGNLLRKVTEEFCQEFLPKRRQVDKNFERLDLNGLLQATILFANEAGLKSDLFEKLDSHRKNIFNVSSHHGFDVPLFRSEIAESFKTLEEVFKIQREVILEPESKLQFELHDGKNLYRADITIYEELILLQIAENESVLSKVFMNCQLYKDGTIFKALEVKCQNIKSLYDKWYANSDSAKSKDFWDEVVVVKTGKKLKELKQSQQSLKKYSE